MGTISDEIKRAMEKHELCAYYQPQYDAMTDRLVSAEALVRWIRPDGRVASPAEFVPELEKTREILDLDWYMAEEACQTLKELGDRALPIAVNFSRWHVTEEDFSDRLSVLLKKYEVPSDLFEVEITESALVMEEAGILHWVKNVQNVRIRVALDDFGSGLSSLQFLKDIPIDILKIDRSLLSENCEPEKERIVLESIFYFANRLNLDTIAEGVETKEQLGFLRTCNCKKIQGFLFAKPMPKEDFVALCRSDRRKQTTDRDILEIQTPAHAMKLLMDAVFQRYPMIIYANLTRNSYYMMAYDNFTTKTCPATGDFDELIRGGAASMHPDDREEFTLTFGRQKLLNAHQAGEKMVRLVSRQIGDDGIYRRIETTDIFVKSPSSDDVLVIILCRDMDE